MLNWIFKPRDLRVGKRAAAPDKASPSPAEVAAQQAQQAAQAAAKAEAKAEQKSRQLEAAKAEWQPRLEAALAGGDGALLEVAQAAPVLEIKLAAVEALRSEDALKQAERAFRDRDRKVHRAAKQRLDAAVALRETRRRAEALIATARALAGQAPVPVNHVATLERDWHALPTELVEPAQAAEYAAWRSRIGQALGEHAERELALQRWTASAKQVLAELARDGLAAASGGDRAALAGRRDAARGLLDSRPAAAADKLAQALQGALDESTRLDERLAWLESLEVPDGATAAAELPREAPTDLPSESPAALAEDAPSEGPVALAEDAPSEGPAALAEDAPHESPAALAEDAPHESPAALAGDLPDEDAATATDPMPQAPEPAGEAAADPAPTPTAIAAGPTDGATDAAPARALSEAPATVDPTPDAPLAAEAPAEAPAGAPAGAPLAPGHGLAADAATETQPPPGATIGAPGATDAPAEMPLASAAATDGPTPGDAPAEPRAAGDATDDERTAGVGDAAVAPEAAPSIEARWQALPPLADPVLAQALDERFARVLQRVQHATRAAEQARAARAAAARPPAEPRAPKPQADAPQLRRIDDALQAAEAALAEGHLADATHHVQALDAAFKALGELSPGRSRLARRQRVQAEFGRLKGWQQWGGGRVRDALVDEAEALARRTQAAADPSPGAPKLKLKAHGDAIQSLRTRWKELDRLGAAASQALWQRFDAALQVANQPVAAQHAALQAAREDNKASREALLAALDAVALPDGQAPEASPEELAARWREPLRALDRFHTAWRQLGPLEHTVPHGARDALARRQRASVERIEAPLREARRAAEARRVELIERAEALQRALAEAPTRPGPAARRGAGDAPRTPSWRDTVVQVRDLQAEWQHQARALPLERAVESTLWTRFKAATDAVFSVRDAAVHARDAELAAGAQAREALLERLAALNDGTAPAEVERTLVEVDRAWRTAEEPPRGVAGALEQRYRETRASAQRLLADAGRRRWQAHCDLLAARLALCEAREQGGADAADLAERWSAQTAQGAQAGLPAPWETALAQRWSGAKVAAVPSASAIDEWLLELEAALGMPATLEQQDARRTLKLRALKEAMEGRRPADKSPPRPDDRFAAVLRQPGIGAARAARLRAIVAALRDAAPGTLLAPSGRG